MSLTYGFCLGEESAVHDSAQFADVFRVLSGDGITPYGARFSLTINGFTATVASGYALSAGRWLENTEPLTIPIQISESNKDRVDALVVRVNYEERRTRMEILVDVDSAAILAEPSSLRNENEYSILLYLIRIRRGATSLAPEDITDLRADPAMCGEVVPLVDISKSALYIYQFLKSGIDAEVARLISLSNELVAKADSAIASLDKQITNAEGNAEIGELMTCRRVPDESGWLLCDGGSVPLEYADLSEMLDGMLPNISEEEDRYKTYIFGGVPVEV